MSTWRGCYKVVLKAGDHKNRNKFLVSVIAGGHMTVNILKTNIPFNMTEEEKREHATKTECDLCKTRFSTKNHKVADHNHLTGRFRQTLCNNCNMELKKSNFVPCLLHNLTNYVAHFIVHKLGYDENTVSTILNNEEKFTSFTKYLTPTFTIQFIDTFRFMASSLSILASNLITTDFSKFRKTV